MLGGAGRCRHFESLPNLPEMTGNDDWGEIKGVGTAAASGVHDTGLAQWLKRPPTRVSLAKLYGFFPQLIGK